MRTAWSVFLVIAAASACDDSGQNLQAGIPVGPSREWLLACQSDLLKDCELVSRRSGEPVLAGSFQHISYPSNAARAYGDGYFIALISDDAGVFVPRATKDIRRGTLRISISDNCGAEQAPYTLTSADYALIGSLISEMEERAVQVTDVTVIEGRTPEQGNVTVAAVSDNSSVIYRGPHYMGCYLVLSPREFTEPQTLGQR